MRVLQYHYVCRITPISAGSAGPANTKFMCCFKKKD
jgi:hypothetical protein